MGFPDPDHAQDKQSKQAQNKIAFCNFQLDLWPDDCNDPITDCRSNNVGYTTGKTARNACGFREPADTVGKIVVKDKPGRNVNTERKSHQAVNIA